MAITTIRGAQVLDGTIQRHDLDVSTVGQAVVAKLIQGTSVTLSSTGGDAGTGDVTISSTGPNAGFVSKTSAYTIVSGDIGKYFICSGGSWTLTLPTASSGFCVYVRNDMGISGTTGTITIARAGSATIDGLTSIALLPGQDCQIATDGINWRTFGLKREVILGTQDITSSTANGVVLLPVGFRYFELVWTSFQPVTSLDALRGQLSVDGGSTWITTASGYINGLIYPSSATVVAYQSIGQSSIAISCGSTVSGQARLLLYPGSSTRDPTWISDSEGYSTSLSIAYMWRTSGLYNGSPGIVNALQYFGASSNIANSFLTVKGVV
jgi:hypothetical protein